MTQILITVGTTAFNTLVKAADKQLREKYDLTFQIADGDCEPYNQNCFKFSENIDAYYQAADLVITHGGAGTIYRLLELNKKIVIVPNLERLDSHQTDISEYMQNNSHAIVCDDLDSIEQFVEIALKSEFVKYQTDEFFGIETITQFLDI